jgi:hypothetical protein
MLDLFASAPKDLRRARLQEYHHYLVERDGELNIQERTLSKREHAIRRYETPPKALRNLDEAEFRKQYVKFDGGKALPQEMVLLLALVKVNSAEAYGVAQNFQRTMNRALKHNDDAELRILCEEGYHTRILLSSANHYGIELQEPYEPPSALRVMIGGIANAPMAIARPLTLAGEIIATLMFMKLLTTTERVLKNDPETRDAIMERVAEICTDERGHITYNRMHMGPLELAQTRMILPMTARIMATVFREMVALGAYPIDILQELPLLTDGRHLPECVRRQSFVA